MYKIMLTGLMATALLVTGCNGTGGMNGYGTKQTWGTVGGAVAGGVLGSNIGGGKGQLIATGAGTVLGALLGSEIGKSLDRADMAYMQQANSQAYSAPIGQTVSWQNPQSGNSGNVTPVNDYTAQNGRYCREYQQTIIVNGQSQTGYGTACRMPDGSWQIVNG